MTRAQPEKMLASALAEIKASHAALAGQIARVEAFADHLSSRTHMMGHWQERASSKLPSLAPSAPWMH